MRFSEKGDDPRRGETGVVWGFGSGGVEPNPLDGRGGCGPPRSTST